MNLANRVGAAYDTWIQGKVNAAQDYISEVRAPCAHRSCGTKRRAQTSLSYFEDLLDPNKFPNGYCCACSVHRWLGTCLTRAQMA